MWDLWLPTVLQGLSIFERDGSYADTPLMMSFKWLTEDPRFLSFAASNYAAHLEAMVEIDPAHQAAMNDLLESCKSNENQISAVRNICSDTKQGVQDLTVLVHDVLAKLPAKMASLLGESRHSQGL